MNILFRYLSSEDNEIEKLYNNIAESNELLGQKAEAMKFYVKSAEINKDISGIDNLSTIISIQNCQRLAKNLNRIDELPDWIKNY